MISKPTATETTKTPANGGPLPWSLPTPTIEFGWKNKTVKVCFSFELPAEFLPSAGEIETATWEPIRASLAESLAKDEAITAWQVIRDRHADATKEFAGLERQAQRIQLDRADILADNKLTGTKLGRKLKEIDERADQTEVLLADARRAIEALASDLEEEKAKATAQAERLATQAAEGHRKALVTQLVEKTGIGDGQVLTLLKAIEQVSFPPAVTRNTRDTLLAALAGGSNIVAVEEAV